MKVWQWLIFIAVCLGLIIMLWLSVLGQHEKIVTIVWEPYSEEEIEPKMFYRVYEIIDWDALVVSEDSLRVETYCPPPPPAITVRRIANNISPTIGEYRYPMHKDNQWHYFIATVVDSVGNETEPGDVGFIYLRKMRSLMGVRAY